jgi:PAS domain S-box-containing protein
MVEGAHMTDKETSRAPLELESLIQRLAETEAALKAITENQVDAVVDPRNNSPIMLRHAQQALQKSENRYRRLINRMSAIVFELEPDGTILMANEAFLPVTGYTPGHIEGKNWVDLFFRDGYRSQVGDLYENFKSGDVSDYELTLLDKNGMPVIIELSSANHYTEDGHLEKIVGFGINISKRKQAEDTLVSSEERFRKVVESVKDYAIFTLDLSGVITSWNIGAERIFGQPAEEVIGHHFSSFYSKEETEAGKPGKILAAAAHEGRYEDENWRQRKDNSRFWANVIITALTDEKGNLVGYSKVVRDMTRRKKAEEEVQRQSQFVRLLQEIAVAANEASSPDPALQFAINRICECTNWNVGHVYMVSEGSDELVPKDIWYPDSDPRYEEFRRESSITRFKKGEGLPGTVYQRGEPVWISDVTHHANFVRSGQAQKSQLVMGFGFPILVGKQVVGVLEFFSDKVDKPDGQLLEVMENIGTQLGRVIERKQSEDALRNSEARFRAIFEGAALGIELIDLDGRILETNPAITQMLGYEAEELRQVTSTDVKHPANTIANMDLFSELRSGQRDSYRIEQPYIRKDGRLGWGRSYVSLVRGHNDQPKFAIGMLEDVTERKHMEAELAELQRRLMEGRETERLQLARELHDGPVQDLYGISFLLKAYSEGLPPQVNLKTIDELLEMLTNVTSTLRNICGELRPPVLAPFGLVKAIRSYADTFQETYPSTKVYLELMPDGPVLPKQVQLVLFRIYQQILNNVGKHANATIIKVRFSVDAELAILQVEDNGTGFNMPARWIELARKGHLGLVSASDRARAIGGHLKVESKPGEGTMVTVQVPYSNVES